MVFEDECTLSLGNCSGIKKDKSFKIGGQSRRSSSARLNHLFPSPDLHTDLSLRLLMNHTITPVRERATVEEPVLLTRSPSLSIPSSMVKREREFFSEELETERLSSRVCDEEEEGSGRKKLRLTKEQSSILEQSFKQHSTLNPKQKEALAKELNMRPRQVEVWFQNRRARTKLKQTEVDCEFLRKCCETLTDDNQRLQKELQELKALKFASTALYMQQQQPLPAATLTMCPSCETLIATKDNSKKSGTNRHFTMTSSNTPFHKLFSHPSAAC